MDTDDLAPDISSESDYEDFNESATDLTVFLNQENNNVTNSKSSENISESENIRHDIIFGPLEVTGSFEYKISRITYSDTEEIIKYSVKNYNNNYYRFCRTGIIGMLSDSIFTRIIRLDLDYINPIIGLLYVISEENSFFISHLSTHEKFRNQGLASLMLCSLAEFIKEDRKYKYLKLIIHRTNTDGIKFYNKIGFTMYGIYEDYYKMQLSVQKFITKAN